jgi:hypothetical protein
MSGTLNCQKISRLAVKDRITDISTISAMSYLTTLKANKNRIGNIDFMADSGLLQFLNHVELKENIIDGLRPIGLKRLLFLDLSLNQIRSCRSFRGHPTLEVSSNLT